MAPAISTVINIFKLLAQNRFRIDLIGYPRVLYSILISLVMSPMRIYENVKFDKYINETKILKDPLLIKYKLMSLVEQRYHALRMTLLLISSIISHQKQLQLWI